LLALKPAEIAAILGTAAVALGLGELGKGDLVALNLLLVALEDFDGLLLASRDRLLAPRRRPAALAVLDQEVRRAQSVSRRRCWLLPCGLVGLCVEVVRDATRLGHSHLPEHSVRARDNRRQDKLPSWGKVLRDDRLRIWRRK